MILRPEANFLVMPPRRGIVIGVILAAVVLGGGVGAPPATAEPSRVSCYFDYGSGVLSVRVPQAGTRREPTPGVAVIRPQVGVITIGDGNGRPLGCSGSLPRTGDVRSIVVAPSRPQRSIALAIDLREAPLPPGAFVDARLGRGQLGVALGPGWDRVAGGTIGAVSVLDLAYDGNVSADVFTSRRATLRLDAGEGDNIVSLAGGSGFDSPWAVPTSIAGRTGADVLVGGASTDLIFGGEGADRMYGVGGNDLLSAAGAGPDLLDCGDGSDVALASGPADAVAGCETRRRRLRPRQGDEDGQAQARNAGTRGVGTWARLHGDVGLLRQR